MAKLEQARANWEADRKTFCLWYEPDGPDGSA
jgi:hypothetical protein